MMSCAEYRRSMLGDPYADRADLRLHRVACPDCTQYLERLRGFEGRLDRALRVGIGAHAGVVAPDAAALQSRPGRPQAPRFAKASDISRRWLAAAASVLVGVVLVGGLWLAAPGPSLAADVVEHMTGEPDAWARTQESVPQAELDQVLSSSQVRLKATAGLVTYSHSCLFRGHLVPHLVVQTEAGPVTVMVLANESVKTTLRFNQHGYQGVIVPVPGHGSLAVLERGFAGDMATMEGIAARVRTAIDWTE